MNPMLEFSVEQALLANRIVGKKNSYAADNPGESGVVLAYLKGGARPAALAVATAMGKHLVSLEDARRADITPTPPAGARTYADTQFGKGSFGGY